MNGIKACERHDRPYFIEKRDYTTSSEVTTFEVALFYRDKDEEKQYDVARLKNQTGTTIFEKLFEPNQPSVPVSLNFQKAVKKLDNNWESYADAYEKNHRP